MPDDKPVRANRRDLTVAIPGTPIGAEFGVGKLSVVWTDVHGKHIVVDCKPTMAEMRLLPTEDFVSRYLRPMIAAIQHSQR